MQQGAGNAAVARQIQRSILARRTAAKPGPAREKRTQHVEGVVFRDEGVDLFSRAKRERKYRLGHLPHGAPIFVVDRDAGGGWARVTTPHGREGYITAAVVKTDLPCPGARIYRLRAGDQGLAIARRFFRGEVKPGRDLRYYVNVLQYVNDGTHKRWQDVEWQAGRSLWIPTAQFANSLHGSVKSGSITGGLWAKTKRAVAKVIDVAVGAGAFVYGALKGAVLTVKEILEGLGSLVGAVIGFVKSLLTGQLLGDVKELWQEIRGVNFPAVMGSAWREFKGRWGAKNPWDRWTFRGEVVGRVVTEVLLIFLTAGVSAILSGTSKFARLTAVVSRLRSVQKLEHAVRRNSHRFRNVAAALRTKRRPVRPRGAAQVERRSRARNRKKPGSGTPRRLRYQDQLPKIKSARQRKLCAARIKQAIGDDGAYDIRVDQAQVAATKSRSAVGARLGNNRPDLQWTDRQGRRHIVEYDTFESTRGTQHLRDALANDPKAIVELWQEIRVKRSGRYVKEYVKVFP